MCSVPRVAEPREVSRRQQRAAGVQAGTRLQVAGRQRPKEGALLAGAGLRLRLRLPASAPVAGPLPAARRIMAHLLQEAGAIAAAERCNTAGADVLAVVWCSTGGAVL